jgi:hypothetical protein
MTGEQRPARSWSSWDWGEEDRRPGVPWIGIFLVVFGALLLLERVFPQFRNAGSAFILAIGVVLLIRWALERRLVYLYVGAIVTALALPNTLQAFGVPANEGLGTLFLGIAFLFIALVRYQATRAIGWQAWFGAILAIIGALRLGVPQLGDLFVPALLIALGALLLTRGFERR